MYRVIHMILIFATSFSLYAQEYTNKPSVFSDNPGTQNKNFTPTSWNQIIGSATIDITAGRPGKSLIYNLLSDAIRMRTDTDFAVLNWGEFNATLYAGEITDLDLFRLCPFDRTLVVLETNGEILYRLIESQISGSRPGLAISGGIVEYDTSRPNNNRMTFFQIGEHPVYPQKEYRVVTTNYLLKGMAGFNVLTEIDSSKVFRTGIPLRKALSEYIQSFSPLNESVIKVDNRWIKK